jgi:hypothetical protein
VVVVAQETGTASRAVTGAWWRWEVADPADWKVRHAFGYIAAKYASKQATPAEVILYTSGVAGNDNRPTPQPN